MKRGDRRELERALILYVFRFVFVNAIQMLDVLCFSVYILTVELIKVDNFYIFGKKGEIEKRCIDLAF